MSELIKREDAIKATWQEPSYTNPYNVLTEVRDRINAIQAASPWHRVEEPPKDGQECVVAFLGPTDWIYEHATYHSDLNPALEEDIFIEGTDGFIVDGNVGYARHGLFKYWMTIEPPKEDA